MISFSHAVPSLWFDLRYKETAQIHVWLKFSSEVHSLHSNPTLQQLISLIKAFFVIESVLINEVRCCNVLLE